LTTINKHQGPREVTENKEFTWSEYTAMPHFQYGEIVLLNQRDELHTNTLSDTLPVALISQEVYVTRTKGR
jgi:hypothetical protein